MRKRNKDNRGFSLVEIIVVIAIISIMAGVAGFGFSLTNAKPAEECARKLTAAISHGRTTTMGKYRNVITIRKETDGKVTVTEDTAYDAVADSGGNTTLSWMPTKSSVVGKGVDISYIIDRGSPQPLGDGEAIQIWYDSGSGAMKKQYKKGQIDNIDALTHELPDGNRAEGYCTGFEISRAGKTYCVELQEHTGRVAFEVKTGSS